MSLYDRCLVCGEERPCATVRARDSRMAEEPRETIAVTTYAEARAQAQERANLSGLDHGVERTGDSGWRAFALPRRENRYGHELRCEVVMAETLDKCPPEHGAGGAP